METPPPKIYNEIHTSLGQIRVLRLKAGNVDEEISCNLEIAHLDDVPDYEALSYVWGNGKDLVPVIFEGQRKMVTRNLRSALIGIRRIHSDRIVWVDALCINQDDLSERSSQVSIMGDIYSMATSVIAYIGEDFDGCDLAMETMTHVSLNRDQHFDCPENERLKFRGVSIAHGGIDWELVYDFLDTVWATRIWTAQEYVLAKRLVVHRSRKSILAIHMNNFMDYLPRHMGQGCCELRPEHKFAAFDTLMYQWRFKTELQSDKSILELLAFYRVRESGDPRDKVYALLGLTSAKYRQMIQPNYQISKEDVFTAIATMEGKMSGRLDFLNHCGPRSPTIPSWVPDWHKYDASCNYGRSSDLLQHYYSADGNNPPDSFVFRGNGELMTFGIKLGRISRQLRSKGSLNMVMEDIPQIWDFVLEERSATSQYDAEQTLRTAFWLTMCGGFDASVRSGSTVRQRLRPEQFESTIKMWEDEVFRGGYEDTDTQMYPFFRDLTHSRCFIETDRGSMGFGSKRCRIGDVVAVLSGGSVPCILRPVSKEAKHEYSFVSVAYIHSFMYGEAFESMERGTAYLEPFRLF